MLKLYFTAFLLVGWSVFSFKITDDECCDTKTVGDVTYELVDERDTSGYGCISNCVYKPVGGNSSSAFCFKRGNLPVTCGDNGPFVDPCLDYVPDLGCDCCTGTQCCDCTVGCGGGDNCSCGSGCEGQGSCPAT